MAIAQTELPDWQPTQEALTLVPETMARVYGVLPLSFENDVLTLVTSGEAGPDLPDIENFLALRKPLVVVRGTREAIAGAIDRHYASSEALLGEDFDPSPDWE